MHRLLRPCLLQCRHQAGDAVRLGEAAGVWKAWAPDLDHRLTRAGHFMAEGAPDEIAAAIRGLLAR
ncbi:hypothetical protein Slala03_74300 [Streptomyces lavendulae subsp. lavendulae]|nr:hypothetical protein Slala03_74300 [Streptomyces lavendulae subsp. lavendulae]